MAAIFECSEEMESRVVEGSNDFNKNMSSPIRNEFLSSNDAVQ